MSKIMYQMKAYEREFRMSLPSRAYTVVRIDGKAFHTFTKNLQRPYDLGFMRAMDAAALALCENDIQGATMAYTQSDEISLLIAPAVGKNSQAWFDGQVQKIVSVAASIATAAFNAEIQQVAPGTPLAFFDARAFSLPTLADVHKYFIWRQRDCTKNAVYMIADTHFGHKALRGKSTDEKIAMLNESAAGWESTPEGFLRGRTLHKETYESTFTYTHRGTGQEHTTTAMRRRWVPGAGLLVSDAGAWTGPSIPG